MRVTTKSVLRGNSLSRRAPSANIRSYAYLACCNSSNHLTDRLSLWRDQRAQTDRRAPDASGLAVLHRARLRPRTSEPLHSFQEPAWMLSRDTTVLNRAGEV